MTKEELMKYANDPFWVKLRWVLFIAFWALWIAMLVGAILIIVLAPKCSAPTPLAWYQKGPLVTIKDENDGDVEKMKNLEVQGVIYELPAEETYSVGSEKVDEKIRQIVAKYNAGDIKVILDLTPNYVSQDDELFKEAKEAEIGSEILEAFATTKRGEVNWLKVNTNDSERAFVKLGKHIFLSQFGNNIDVRMNNDRIKKRFQDVLQKLIDLGVKGFRLNNAKHFIIGDTTKDDTPRTEDAHSYTINQYKFYGHTQSTYQPGLGDLIQEFTKLVHNKTNDEGFLTVTDSITSHEIQLHTSRSTLGFDLPKLSIVKELETTQSPSAIPKKIFNVFGSQERYKADSLSNIWMQLPFTADSYKNTEPSAFYMFISFMRGVLIAPFDAYESISNLATDRVKILREERKKDAVQFGKFDIILSLNDTGAIGYTR